MRHVIPLGAGGRGRGGYIKADTGGGVWRGSSFIVVVRRVLRFFVEMLNKVVIVL